MISFGALSQTIPWMSMVGLTYSAHPEISEDTSCNTSHYTSVLDLGRSGVAVHFAEFDVSSRSYALRQRGVSNDVSQSLSRVRRISI